MSNLELLLLDDEPIVGKRLKPALAKVGCEVEVFSKSGRSFKAHRRKGF